MRVDQLQNLLKQMTLAQKLGQLTLCNYSDLVCAGDATDTGPRGEFLLTENQKNLVGSVMNFIGAKEAIELQKKHMQNDPLKIPLLFMMDVIHGFTTAFPIPLAFGCTFDTELTKTCMQASAKEAAVSGVHVTFSPMVDLSRDARWGRVMEGTGEDPYLNCQMGEAFVKGYQGNFDNDFCLAACVKHFAAYGAPLAGREYNSVDMSLYSLRQYYLPSYRACINAGAKMVMSAFNYLNGQPCTGNSFLMKEILRDEWQFNGVVISDYNAVAELVNHGYKENLKEAAYTAMDCNCDIEMVSTSYLQKAEELIEEKRLDEKQIDQLVLRVLTLKNELGLFENPFRSASEENEKKYHRCAEHLLLAQQAAECGCVLLKNNGILPLDEKESFALIGPFADSKTIIGAWSCNADKEKATTILQAFNNQLKKEIPYSSGCGDALSDTDMSKFDSAIQLAKATKNVIMVIGESSAYSGECRSRTEITIPEIQQRLFDEIYKVNKNIVVVLITGRPLDIRKLEGAAAVFTMWQPGTEGGNACFNLLFGKSNFSGKLAMSFPYCVGQLPISYSEMRTGRPYDKNGDPSAWRSTYIDAPNAPLYPFGFGLSYSNFVYSNLFLSKKEIGLEEDFLASVQIENKSDRDGFEIVQLYIGDKFSSMARPIKELKGFKKIFISARQKVRVEFTITGDLLSCYNEKGEERVQKGLFNIYIGKNSNEVLESSFCVK